MHLDDVVVYANSWEDHLYQLMNLFLKLREAQLAENLAKTTLGCAYKTYFGHQVGQSQVNPVIAKVEAISSPKNIQEVMHFGEFYMNLSLVAEALTHLLCNFQPFSRNMNCAGAFKKIKGYICQHLSK